MSTSVGTDSGTIKKSPIFSIVISCSLFTVSSNSTLLVVSVSGTVIPKYHRSENGSATEDIITEYDGQEIEIGFNSKYIYEMINQLDDEKVVLKFNESSSPVIASELSNPNLLYVLMPMRV